MFVLVLHPYLFIEIHLFDELKLKYVIATKNTFLINPNIYIICHVFH